MSVQPGPEKIWPSQCSCGHIFLERYEFGEPLEDGTTHFCWCGFCCTRLDMPGMKEKRGTEGKRRLARRAALATEGEKR